MTNGRASVHSTRRDNRFGRLRVDVANTAFWEGKEYRIDLEYSVGATPIVIKFSSPINFILQSQTLACDQEAVRLRVYRDSQGVEGGTFSQVQPIYKVNFMTETPSVPNQVSITKGGTFTPNGGEVAVETIRVRAANATAQKATVSGAIGDERGLPPGTYYLILERLAGSANAEGVYYLKWEERA